MCNDLVQELRLLGYYGRSQCIVGYIQSLESGFHLIATISEIEIHISVIAKGAIAAVVFSYDR